VVVDSPHNGGEAKENLPQCVELRGQKMRKHMKRGVAIALILAAVASALVYGSSMNVQEPAESSDGSNQEERNLVLLGPSLKKPEIVTQYGVAGYVEFNRTEDTPDTLTIAKGGEVCIGILVHFKSYDPDVREVQLSFDPKNNLAFAIERYYTTVDEEGNLVKRSILVNELVSYDVSGVVSIPAGGTLRISLTVRTPIDFPSGVDFNAGALGVEVLNPDAGIWIIDNTRVTVHA
jgi:hypothetical protein